MEPSDILSICRIGFGGTATVFKCVQKSTEEKVAVKNVLLSGCDVEQSKLRKQLAANEIQILKGLDHPNIIRYLGSFEDKDKISILMELANYGTLLNYDFSVNCSYDQAANSKRIFNIFQQICSAIGYLHETKKIMHRDLKAENILFTNEERDQIKLCDFGYSTSIDNVWKARCGSPFYISPEMLKGEGYTEKCDIWCLGIILYFLAVGKLPFSDRTAKLVFDQILNKEVEFPDEVTDEGLKDLIYYLLEKDPKKRPSISDVYKHDWMMKMSGNHSVLFNIKLSKIHNPNSKSSTSSYSSTDSSIDSCMESGTGRSIGSFCNRSQCNNLDGSTTNNSINCDKRNNNKNPQRNGLTNYQDESNSFNNTVRRNAEGLLSHKYGVFKGVSGRRVCPIKTDRKVSARLIQPQPKSKVCL